MAKNLIIYYSRKGENYVNGSIRDLKKRKYRNLRRIYSGSSWRESV